MEAPSSRWLYPLPRPNEHSVTALSAQVTAPGVRARRTGGRGAGEREGQGGAQAGGREGMALGRGTRLGAGGRRGREELRDRELERRAGTGERIRELGGSGGKGVQAFGGTE